MDLLAQAGLRACVQRYYTGSIAGEIPPDQALPEVWVIDDAELPRARQLLAELHAPVHRCWTCPGCSERIDGPFEQCWRCGAMMPLP